MESQNEIDGILDPINNQSKKDTDRMESLRSLLKADPIKFPVQNHIALETDFPPSQHIKSIDHTEEKLGHTQYATIAVEGFIDNYIKDKKLLTSSRLQKMKQKHIEDIAELQYIVKNTERNLISIQESIDAGDVSIEMFKLSREISSDLRASIKDRSIFYDKCELYWQEYADRYGLTSEEEDIIKAGDTSESKTMILDQSALNAAIEKQLAEKNNRKK